MENSEIFKYIPNEDPNPTALKALDLILGLKPNEILNNQQAYDALLFLKHVSNLINLDILNGKKLEDALCSILFEVFKIRSSLIIKTENGVLDMRKANAENERKVFILNFCLVIVNYLSIRSVKFARDFSFINGLDVHFMFLKDENFFNSFTSVTLINENGKKINLIEQIFLNIYIFSKNCDDHMFKWIELDAVNTLLSLIKHKSVYDLDAYLTITNVANDKQIENLTEIHGIVEHIQDKIALIADDFRNKNFKRLPRQIIDEDQIINVQVHCVYESNEIMSSLLVFLSGLYRLSVNDKLRNDIYFNKNFSDNLKVILFDSNEIETKYALKLYAQLSFNSQITNNMLLDQDLINFINNIKSDTNKSIQELCEQISWNIEQNKLSKESVKNSGEHIMISYNSASRELCLKIKSRLESLGHKVWIDVGNIHGSSLDSMAQAVEKSICVLVCVTEKYRQSINCQSEALYAFRLNKPIIPLILQKNYENVQGWLGIIMGDKIFVNFTKYEFDECMNRLNGEIKNLPSPFIKEVKKTETHLPVEKWDELRVKQWFESNNLSMNIMKKFNPCNGIILHQLYEMRRDAPEFFYQSLKCHEDISTVLNFTFFLKKLFEDK